MHNISNLSFEPSQDARALAASEGNTRPEDIIPIYRERTHIDSSGKETETQAKYFRIVDSVEALTVRCRRLGQGGMINDNRADLAVLTVQVERADTVVPSWCVLVPLVYLSIKGSFVDIAKGIYVSWANDPPNTKIKDCNVMELRIDPHR
ncbi:hypothetical protein DXG01_006397 [Tephrocybe rancida]|nr:hypothetical protein DXG01_006397 [Tephrocybe rancida]